MGTMPALYILDQGAALGKESERIVVRKEGAVIAEFPLARIEKVLLFGAVQVSTQAIGALLEARIPTASGQKVATPELMQRAKSMFLG